MILILLNRETGGEYVLNLLLGFKLTCTHIHLEKK